MPLRTTARVRSRVVAGIAALAVSASLITVLPQIAQAAPPPNPTDQQIQQAKDNRDAIAGTVAKLGAKVANLQAQLGQLQAAEELAEQKYALALQKLQEAQHQAATTKKAASAAQDGVVQAQQEFVAYAQAAYMNGGVDGMTGTLLTASDPSALLQRSALQGYQTSHQIGAINDLQRATVAKSNADAAARLAVRNRTSATAAADVAKENAIAAVHTAQAREKTLQKQVASAQASLQRARSEVATLNGQRAAYNKWYKHQQEIIAARKRAEQLARERAAAAAAAAARARQHSPSSSSSTPMYTGGAWTAAKGREAAQRAEQWLGTMYAWAGGNAYGPTYGVCAGDGAFNDCHVVGFDCSGLVMYAWGPWLYLAHYAATQYNQAGSYHPSAGNFQPGDLLFWSSNGTVAGIHHVAIYIGNGNVVQAPESGSPVQITNWQSVSWGYYGATRPLT